MRLLIGIATYKRMEKLKRLIRSLDNQTYKEFQVVVVADNNDLKTANDLNDMPGNIHCVVQPNHQFVIGAWNRTIREIFTLASYEYFMGLCDDVELNPTAIEEALRCHQQFFPDTDGVIGFKQLCPGHPEYTFKWFGQTLMGRKFIERYKNVEYKICCPDYYHFCQDEEMYNYAQSLNKFANCEEAILKHYHPGFIKEEIDETHNIIRSGSESPKRFDFCQQKKRIEAQYLWGRDFNLIGGKNE